MNEGCIACGLCEGLCPEVFKIEDVAIVIEGINYDDYNEKVIEAAGNCPVEVIKYE